MVSRGEDNRLRGRRASGDPSMFWLVAVGALDYLLPAASLLVPGAAGVALDSVVAAATSIFAGFPSAREAPVATLASLLTPLTTLPSFRSRPLAIAPHPIASVARMAMISSSVTPVSVFEASVCAIMRSPQPTLYLAFSAMRASEAT